MKTYLFLVVGLALFGCKKSEPIPTDFVKADILIDGSTYQVLPGLYNSVIARGIFPLIEIP